MGHSVETLVGRFEDPTFKNSLIGFDGDAIINCVGAIPQKTKDFKINTDLPIWLSNNVKCRVVHPGTDCEMDDDLYGKSKKLAREYIELYSKNTKVLKTSIVGPENGTGYGLMEWFHHQSGEVTGYTKAIWNGNTTLEWCRHAESLLEHWDDYATTTILQGSPISKYEMLVLFREFYGKTNTIHPVEKGQNKCLSGGILTVHLKDQLDDLKKFLSTE
jgi:dTDP-4-dehydrorhamnose reductase